MRKGLVVLCTVACLGLGVLVARTPTGPDVGDLGYISCNLDVQGDVQMLMQEWVVVFKPVPTCAAWRSGNFTARTERLIARHDGCPEPVADCLTEARGWTGKALESSLESCRHMDSFCATMDTADLGRSEDRLEDYTAFTELAVSALKKCEW